MGFYSFGGSTNVVLFKAGVMKWDDDILYVYAARSVCGGGRGGT